MMLDFKFHYLSGWGKSEIKAKLSPAGAGAWAELGNKTFIIFISSLASPLLDYVAPTDPLHGAQLLHLLSQVLELLQLPSEGPLGAVLDGQQRGDIGRYSLKISENIKKLFLA